MAEKTLKSRIIHKHDTAANWLKGANFIPKQGEIIVYDIDADYTYERFKIGDGKTAVNSLPFADGALKDYVDAELDTLVDEISALDSLVGDTSVSSQITTAIANKADASHTHDDRYYTESEVDTKLSAKADVGHTHDSVSYADSVAWANVTGKPSTYTPAAHSHAISDVTNLQTTLDAKVPTSRTVNGKALSANITLSASDVGADASGAANTALTSAKSYTDAQMTAMVGDDTVANQISDAISAVEGQIIDPTFYVKFTRQSDTTYTADKTYAVVEAAYVAGQNVIGLLDLGLEMLYHIPVLYCVTGYAIAFHTNLESSDPITIAYGADGTIVVQTYAKIASKTDVTDAIAAIDYPVDSVNGKTGAVVLSASDVGADTSGAASTALTNAKSYTDTRISAMVGDTAVATQISSAVSTKSDTDHTHKYAGSSSVGGPATSANKLNTNAGTATNPVYFANGIPVATTYSLNANVPSDAKFSDTVYTHPTTAGNKHIPSGGSSGQILKWSADGTAAWGAETTYSNATTSAAGLMSAADKTTLDRLDVLVGDTAVSEQISAVTDTKADITAGVYAVTASSSDGVTYTATVPGITSLTAGVSFIMIPDRVSASTTPTINVNDLGAKYIRRRLSNLVTSVQPGYTTNWLAANNAFTLTYDGTQWIVGGLTKPVAADLYGTLSVAKGGTGATDAVAARENLLMVVSDTEPTSPETGMLWFDIS